MLRATVTALDVPDADAFTLLLLHRWCRNIGRQHKSNGVYIVVDLSAGLWWQKCFDPDCRAYRSETMPLPPGLVPSPQPASHSPPSSDRLVAR